MNPIESLKELFTSLPGIGKRQAERFVYFLLRQDSGFRGKLAETITSLNDNVVACTKCHRFFAMGDNKAKECNICSDVSRDKKVLLIVSQDADLQNIESNGIYKGSYFVLGGTVPILDKDPDQKIRIAELKNAVQDQKPKEIIIGLSTSPEGENTREYVTEELIKINNNIGFTVTTLGRGLSTGAELEYSDPDTIRSALENRS